MKFFSKNANLMVVLKQGLPGNSQLGTAMISGIYARFKDGVIDFDDENMIQLMQRHPGFNVDFVRVEDPAERDPYSVQRQSSEPTHVISEMEFGHPKRVTKAPMNVTPEVRAALVEMAKEMARPMAIELSKQMLPEMIRETLKALSEDNVKSEEKVETPKKVKVK